MERPFRSGIYAGSGRVGGAYAARTVFRNSSTAERGSSASSPSCLAEPSTSSAAEPVSAAAYLTMVMFEETSWVVDAAC